MLSMIFNLAINIFVFEIFFSNFDTAVLKLGEYYLRESRKYRIKNINLRKMELKDATTPAMNSKQNWEGHILSMGPS